MLCYGNPKPESKVKRGSKVIVTTRNPNVAERCRDVEAVNLKPIKDEEACWSIFKNMALKKKDQTQFSELEAIGKEIVKKCNGIPLVAKYLGAQLLLTKNKTKWKSVRDKEIYELHKSTKPVNSEARKILSSLRLTYIHDMHAELKLCFAYCSIFLKGHEIDATKLVQQWLALGLVQPAEANDENQYLDDLISMSFLLEDGSYENNRTKKCKIQNLVHDLARLVAGDGATISSFAGDETRGKKYHYVTMAKCKENVSNINYECLRKARALQFRECENGKALIEIFSKAERLCVLDLSGISNLEKLPDAIKKMKKLRYLDASNLCENQCSGFDKLPNLKFHCFADSKVS